MIIFTVKIHSMIKIIYIAIILIPICNLYNQNNINLNIKKQKNDNEIIEQKYIIIMKEIIIDTD